MTLVTTPPVGSVMSVLMLALVQLTADKLPVAEDDSPIIKLSRPFWLVVTVCVSAYCTVTPSEARIFSDTVTVALYTSSLALLRTTA